ncbi:MAG: MFS transporter [Actinobacteria bacterium]|nr:MFS transporter [Actinomycetota bacterium]MBV8395370.1 MFS transporter [Actinomycetota bacterium]
MDEAALEPARRSTLAAFSSRDFRLLWGGQTISFVGDAAFLVALGWRVTDLTGRASSLGYVLALQSLAMLTTLLLGGVLADRYPRRRLMISSDIARALVVGGFLAIELTGHMTLGAVLGLAAAFGLADGFFQPAFSGIVPLVVETPLLPSANSWLSIARQSSSVVGPGIAAGLYGAVGPSPVWGIDAASFLVSATALALARPRDVRTDSQSTIKREFVEGFRYVVSVPWIWTGILAATVILMIAMAPFNALLPRVVQNHYGRGVGSYGLLFSLMAAGMVAGSLAWARWHPRRHRVFICFAAFGINDIGIAVLGLSPWYWLAAAAVVWRGFFIGIGIASWTTLITQLVPERLLSRVFSFDFFGSFGLTPVGYAAAAAAATAIAPTTILAVGGSVAVALWFVPLTWDRVRNAA